MTISEFWYQIQVGVDVYIFHQKYQAKSLLSLCFQPACAAAIAHRNHFFHLYQQNKSSSLRKASGCYKWVLKITKLAYAYKAKQSIN